MARGLKKENLKGRNFALTIILGVFIAIMVIVLFNLIVSYAYEGPKYEKYCKGNIYGETYPVKETYINCANCTFSKELQTQTDKCMSEGGFAVYERDDNGCNVALKECNMCQKNYDNDLKQYNKNTFFVFAFIGFALIVVGLLLRTLLLQLVTLPSGAFLVIEAAMKNFDSKLAVIIVFALLIVAAIYLALKKLR